MYLGGFRVRVDEDGHLANVGHAISDDKHRYHSMTSVSGGDFVQILLFLTRRW